MYSVDPPIIDMKLAVGLESRDWTMPPVRTDRDTVTMKEQFNIRTRGWMYHPELVEFSIALRPEFEQSEEEWNTGYSAERKATFLGFLIDANLMPYDPYTLNLHAARDRRDTTTTRALGDTTTEYSLYGARLLAKHPTFPTTVALESKDRTSETFFAKRHEQTQRFHLRSRHRTTESRSWMEAEVMERDVTSRDIESSSRRVGVRADNQVRFGRGSQAISHFTFADQTSATSSSTTTAAASRVNLTHSDNLDTRYEVKYDDRDVGDFETRRGYAAAALRHQLYENLATKLNAEVDRRQGTDVDLNESEAGADFAYTRPIPLGRLYLNVGHQERYTDYQRRSTFARTRDEPHRLVGGYESRVVLGKADIDVETVRVSDVDGNEYLVELDYELEQDGDRVYLWRTLLGAIEDGEEVLVDYEYETDPSVDLARITNSFGAAIDLWSTLKLYQHQSKSDIHVRSGIEPEDIVHSSDLVGAELRWRRGPIASSTAVERADVVTAVVSTKTARARQRLAIGTWSRTEIEAEDEKADEMIDEATGTAAHTRTKTVRARQQFNAGRWGITDFEAEDRRIDGDITERTELPTTTYRLRQTLAFGGWSITTLEAEDITLNGDLADFPPTRFRHDVTPATKVRIRQSLAFRLTPALRAGFSGHYFERERKDTGLRSEGSGFSASVNWNIGAIGLFNARGFRQVSRSGDNSERRLGLDARYEWRYGAWYPSLHYAANEERRRPSGELRKDSLLFFEVRRTFW